MIFSLRALASRMEVALAGELPVNIRGNMRIEIWVSMAYGFFYATTLPFIPVSLRRSGATPEMLAIYTSQQFVVSVLTAFSIVLMRRRRTMNVIVVCWILSRSVLLFFAFTINPLRMLILGALFWLLEAFPNPRYTRILQKMYPDGTRGKIMSIVRMARFAVVVLITPLAGWTLDHVGYQVLFPIGSLIGILSVFFFTRLDVNEGALPVRETKTLSELWHILRDDRRFAFYLTSFGIYGAGSLLSWTIYPLIQVDRLQLSYSTLGWLGLVQSLFWMLGYLFWGRLVDRHGGVWVLRLNCAIAIYVPFSYIWVAEPWMLIPTFAVQGIINAGWDMGMITAGMQLAPRERVTEYAAVQGTIVGLRGMIIPLIGVTLLRFGFPYWGIFFTSISLLICAWFMFGRVYAPMPDGKPTELRYRWPLRFRWPKD